MTYEIEMTSGDRAEAGSVLALLTAARTLVEDSAGEARVVEVRTNVAGMWHRCDWATQAAKQHVTEVLK